MGYSNRVPDMLAKWARERELSKELVAATAAVESFNRRKQSYSHHCRKFHLHASLPQQRGVFVLRLGALWIIMLVNQKKLKVPQFRKSGRFVLQVERSDLTQSTPRWGSSSLA